MPYYLYKITPGDTPTSKTLDLVNEYDSFRVRRPPRLAPIQVAIVPIWKGDDPKEEILRFPRAWVERHYNVKHWAVMPRGGHFAAMEQPGLFVEDLRSFFRTVR